MITLITPVWNGVKTIAETIESVRLQQPYCTQYIVLDSDSNDGTSELVKTMGNVVTHYIREKDGGLYDAMNKGIQRATGEIIGIINADDTLINGALKRVAEAFADPMVDFVYSDVEVFDDAGRDLGLFKARPEWVAGATYWHGRDWRFIVPLSHPGLFVRRRVYEEIGGFDLKFRLAADHEFIARLIARGRVGRYIPKPLSRFRVGGLSGSDFSIFTEDEIIAKRYGVPAWLAKLNRYRSILGRIKQRALKISF